MLNFGLDLFFKNFVCFGSSFREGFFLFVLLEGRFFIVVLLLGLAEYGYGGGSVMRRSTLRVFYFAWFFEESVSV